jgi:hypothetical protein
VNQQRPFRRGMDPRANFPYDALGFGGSNLGSEQPDEKQFQMLRRAIRNMVPLECVIELMQAKNSPPQVRQNIYHAHLTAANQPVLLIPTNNKRMGFVVSNDTANDIRFSYDWPYQSASGVFKGIPILAETPFLEANGLASVNDIYVWAVASEEFEAETIIGYEAVVTITPENAEPGIGGR